MVILIFENFNLIFIFNHEFVGKTDSTQAFQRAVNDGRDKRKVVYIPKGNYLIYDHIIVDNVQLVGAGPWYSVLFGKHPSDKNRAVGVYGKPAGNGGSKNVVLKDFAISGDIHAREDQYDVSIDQFV